MKIIRTLVVSLLFSSATLAQAAIIDFVELTEGTNQLGESAWNTLTVTTSEFEVDITGSKNGAAATAYLDWNHAGLGVCGNPHSTGAYPNSGRNRCNPGSDDNVTFEEVLSFIFDVDVVINKIWLNNTHDPDFTIDADDRVDINGVATPGPGNGYATGNKYNNMIGGASVSNQIAGPILVAAGSAFTIGFNDQQFYVSGMDVSAVPEPSTLGLLGLGLVGLAFMRRRQA